MSEEEIKDKLRKMLYHTQRANECGLSNNDFKEDIDTLSGTLELLDKKDKVIDLMAEVIEECRQNDVIEFNENIDLSEIAGENRIKEYFYKKVEELGWNE